MEIVKKGAKKGANFEKLSGNSKKTKGVLAFWNRIAYTMIHRIKEENSFNCCMIFVSVRILWKNSRISGKGDSDDL